MAESKWMGGPALIEESLRSTGHRLAPPELLLHSTSVVHFGHSSLQRIGGPVAEI